MANQNRIILVGRLTADPEMRSTMDGIPMTKFTLTVDKNFDGEPDLIPVVSWRKLAEICGQYLKKGKLILVEGRIQVRSYDTQNGKRYATEVVARNMKMLDKTAKEPAVKSTQSQAEPDYIPEDEIF